MVEFNPYYEWLGIPPHEQPADHYQLLGLARFESNPSVIANAAERQLSHLRMFQSGPRSEFAAVLLNEVARAKVCLSTPEHKRSYDEWLRSQIADQVPAETAAAGPEPSITIRPVRASRRSHSNRGARGSLILAVQVVIGGILGIVVPLLVLWYGFRLDPFDIWESEHAVAVDGAPANPQELNAPNVLKAQRQSGMESGVQKTENSKPASRGSPAALSLSYLFYEWSAGQPPIKMLHRDEGFCYLIGVHGALDGYGESAQVKLESDGFWYLTGTSARGNQDLIVRAAGVKIAELARTAEIEALRPADESTAQRKDDDGELQILAAFYGQNVNWFDVTDKVQQAAKGKSTWSTIVNTDDRGEPAPNFEYPRTLIVRFSINGASQSKWAYQGAELVLP